MSKRFFKEFIELKEMYGDDIELIRGVKYNRVILKLNCNIIQLSVKAEHSRYPFLKPWVKVNGVNYADILNNIDINDYREIMEDHYGNICCALCRSITCHYNWSPLMKLRFIIEEVDSIMTIKKRLIERKLCRKVEYKNYIPRNFIAQYL